MYPNLADQLEPFGIGWGTAVRLSECIVEASTKSWAVLFSLFQRHSGGKHEGWRILLTVPADGMGEDLERLIVQTVVLQIPATWRGRARCKGRLRPHTAGVWSVKG